MNLTLEQQLLLAQAAGHEDAFIDHYDQVVVYDHKQRKYVFSPTSDSTAWRLVENMGICVYPKWDYSDGNILTWCAEHEYRFFVEVHASTPQEAIALCALKIKRGEK